MARVLTVAIVVASFAGSACKDSNGRHLVGTYDVGDGAVDCTDPTGAQPPIHLNFAQSTARIDDGDDGLSIDLLEFPGCVLTATEHDDGLEIPTQTCESDSYDENDIHGTAARTDDDLVLDLDSTRVFPPSQDAYPTGASFDCHHHYVLTVPSD